MKDRVEMDHLTKFDAFMWKRDQGMGLYVWFKIYTNVSNFLTAFSKIFHSCIMASCSSNSKFANVASVNEFIEEQENVKTIIFPMQGILVTCEKSNS